MNKKFIYYFLIVVFVGALPKTASVIHSKLTPKPQAQICTDEAKTCPDDTSVRRTGPNCEFALCPAPTQVTVSTSSQQEAFNTASTSLSSATPNIVNSEIKKIVPPVVAPIITTEVQKEKPTFISKIVSTIAAAVNTVTSPFKQTTVTTSAPSNTAATPPASINITTTNTTPAKSLPPVEFAGQKYLVRDNTILSKNNDVIYTIPQEVITAVSSPNSGWTNTTINVVPVGTVAPILNAIPIENLPGKYYLSENSFGDLASCEFSNKIFILDTNTNTVELMYEENNTTLSQDDPRACNSEIFLLATEGSKLVLKYHTIGTNTLCDSTWSEPEKTFYLDVVKLKTEGMMKYSIPANLTTAAEQEEETCRAKL
jgi:hypothetical protein